MPQTQLKQTDIHPELKKSHYFCSLQQVNNHETPLKNLLSGYELETVLLDGDGFVQHSADNFMGKVQYRHPNTRIVKEFSKHIIEIHSFPKRKVIDTFNELITHVENSIDVAEKNGLKLYPFGTYPGNFKPIIRKTQRNEIQEKIIPDDRFRRYATKCYGFHYHHTLPRGVYNKKKGFLKKLVKSKVKQTLIDSYNMLIALDPAATCLLQSSPFVDGQHLAKDSRLLYYRGGKRLAFNGLYTDFQLLGGLPPYKQTMADLMCTLRRKDARVKKEMKKSGYNHATIQKKQALDLVWNPVKINPIGTLEYRGADMNLPSNILQVSLLIKQILTKIKDDFLHVIPSDIGLEEPFKMEGNLVYIPPHSCVRNNLQYLSAYKGLEDEIIAKYCRQFFNFGKKLLDNDQYGIIKGVANMIDNNVTMSDILMRFVKNKGYELSEKLPDNFCAELALKCSNLLTNDIYKTKKILEIV